MGDNMKDKMKDFVKKVNNPFSSSSKFKGQGRVLGSSSSGPANNPIHDGHLQNTVSRPSPTKPLAQGIPNSEQNSSNFDAKSSENRKPTNGFDPFDSLITTGKRSQNGYSLNVFECPVCGQSFRSEEEVSVHVDSCVNSSVHSDNVDAGNVSESPCDDSESRNDLEVCIGSFLSGNLSEGSVEVVLRLLRNIIKEPENTKFRKIRMSNPKIRDAIGEVAGGVELLEFVGFELQEDGGEMWAIMEVPTEERIDLINKAISLLEPQNMENSPSSASVCKPGTEQQGETKKIDRQIRVFFSVSESVAARIQLPDSFYNLSVDELKREANLRKKKIEESQLLIPKSYKEKQAKAARKRYRRTLIRIQFPDGVVLQGVFAPWEPTTALYKFVSSALKEPSLEYELLHPVLVKRRVIPHFPAAGKRSVTLDEEDLVPSALIKFKPIETDSIVFTGLCNELLEIIEPLVNESAVPQL